MNYPVWQLDIGGGVLMAVVSVLHVFVSHFAIGGGLWLVVTEARARARGDVGMLDFVRRHSRFFILLTLVFGAITGVGIWFVAGLISPAAINTLIRTFLWGWAIEWVFFVIEIAAALVYWYGWDRLSARAHLAVGWIYFGAAFMSLAVINGIVTFMLTPGGWLENREFWTGFFNPTYWPSLAIRGCAAVALAGLFTLLTAAFLDDAPLRRRMVRHNALWVLAGTVLAAGASYWYRSAFPGWDEALLGAIPVLPTVASVLRWTTAAVIALALWPLIAPGRWHAGSALVLLAIALAAFGAGEWVREAGRKPYVIHGYLYSNGVRIGSQEAALAADGVARHTKWIHPARRDGAEPAALGSDLYRAWCAQCHTMDRYNGLRPFLAYRNAVEIADLLPHLGDMRALMPPWHGDRRDDAALSAYLAAEGATCDAAWPEDPVRAGGLAWDLSCGLCHTADRFRPLRESLAGMEREELSEMLDALDDYSDRMPAYTAGDAERRRLLDHLQGLAGTGATAERSTR